jgi:hypothetical protein
MPAAARPRIIRQASGDLWLCWLIYKTLRQKRDIMCKMARKRKGSNRLSPLGDRITAHRNLNQEKFSLGQHLDILIYAWRPIECPTSPRHWG